MHRTVRAGVGLTALVGLLLSLLVVAAPASAGRRDAVLEVAKTVAGTTDTEDFEFVAACDQVEPLGAGAQATIDVPFTLVDGGSEVLSEQDLGTFFPDGVQCSVAEQITEGVEYVLVAAFDSEGNVLAADTIPGTEELAELTFQTNDEDPGDYLVVFTNVFPGDGDLCALAERYAQAGADFDDAIGFGQPIDVELAVEEAIEVLAEAVPVLPDEYQDAIGDLLAAWVAIDQLLGSVDYDIEALGPEQLDLFFAIGELADDAQAALAPAFEAACAPAPTPAPLTPAAQPATATPRFTG